MPKNWSETRRASAQAPELHATDDSVEPNRFFREFVGLHDDQIREIREGKAVAKILDSPTADQVFVFGSVCINSTWERYLKLASDIDALRKLPSYIALQKFSEPTQLFFMPEPENRIFEKFVLDWVAINHGSVGGKTPLPDLSFGQPVGAAVCSPLRNKRRYIVDPHHFSAACSRFWCHHD